MGAYLSSRFEYRAYEPDLVSYAAALHAIGDAGTIFPTAVPSEPDAAFDAVVAFEVLEHIEDDIAALSAWVRWLEPGGIVVLSVPAYADRFGPWDVAVGHFRRYERSQLAAVMTAAGLEEVEIEPWGFPLGLLSEWVRHRLAPDHEGLDDQERTLKSGRLLQPSQVQSGVFRAAAKLVSPLQRATDRGIGWVASGLSVSQ